MECILHIAYRLKIRSQNVANKEDKESMHRAKKRICHEFKEKMGLIVFQLSQESASSNFGKTAPRFFSDIGQASAITVVNEELIKMLSNIIQMQASSGKMTLLFFNEYALRAAKFDLIHELLESSDLFIASLTPE